MRSAIYTALMFIFVLATSGCGNNQSSAPSDAGKTQAAQTSKTYNWKMVTTWPPNFPIFQEGVERFAAQIKTMSNGRLEIKVYAGGELVPPLQTFEAVSQGTVELGHGGAYYWAGKIPAAQFFTSVPFGLNAQGMRAWLISGGGLALWREIYQDHGVIPYPMGSTGVQMGGWFNKEINSVADLKGLKMRIPGLGGKVLAKAGGTPVLMAGGEIYTALERGTIDATEWVGPFHDERLGLYRAAKYYYYPGWHEPGTELELLINSKAWESLTPDLKAIVENANYATSLWMLSEFEARNLDALTRLQTEHKVQVREFPADMIRELKKLAAEVYTEESGKNADFKKVYEAYQAFQMKNNDWNNISEQAYRNALNLK